MPFRFVRLLLLFALVPLATVATVVAQDCTGTIAAAEALSRARRHHGVGNSSLDVPNATAARRRSRTSGGARGEETIAHPVRAFRVRTAGASTASASAPAGKTGARPAGQAVDRRPSVRQHVGRPGARVLRRRHGGGHHRDALTHPLVLRHRAELRLPLQGQGRGRAAGRPWVSATCSKAACRRREPACASPCSSSTPRGRGRFAEAMGGSAVQAKAMSASVDDIRPSTVHVEIKLKDKSGIVLISLANANKFAAVYPKRSSRSIRRRPRPPNTSAPDPSSSSSGSRTSTSGWSATTTTSRGPRRTNGYGGRKVAYVDEIRDPDAGSRPRGRHLESRRGGLAPMTSRPWPTTVSRTTRRSDPRSCGRTPGASRSSTRRRPHDQREARQRGAGRRSTRADHARRGGEPALYRSTRAGLHRSSGLALEARRRRLQPERGRPELLQRPGTRRARPLHDDQEYDRCTTSRW